MRLSHDRRCDALWISQSHLRNARRSSSSGDIWIIGCSYARRMRAERAPIRSAENQTCVSFPPSLGKTIAEMLRNSKFFHKKPRRKRARAIVFAIVATCFRRMRSIIFNNARWYALKTARQARPDVSERGYLSWLHRCSPPSLSLSPSFVLSLFFSPPRCVIPLRFGVIGSCLHFCILPSNCRAWSYKSRSALAYATSLASGATLWWMPLTVSHSNRSPGWRKVLTRDSTF